jgi:hypothetical protein
MQIFIITQSHMQCFGALAKGCRPVRMNRPVPQKINAWRPVGHQKKDGVFFLCQATECSSTLRPVSIK